MVQSNPVHLDVKTSILYGSSLKSRSFLRFKGLAIYFNQTRTNRCGTDGPHKEPVISDLAFSGNYHYVGCRGRTRPNISIKNLQRVSSSYGHNLKAF
jgi:hypothetical protein